MSIEPVNHGFLLSYDKMGVCLGFLLIFSFWLCSASSSNIWLSDLEAESSEGAGETTSSSSLLPDSETGSGTLGRSGQASVVQVLWIILVVAASSRPACLALPFLGGVMITRMQDCYDVCHNCLGVRLDSLKRRTRMRIGRNVLGLYSRQVRTWLQLRSERTRNEMKRTYLERVRLSLNELRTS